MLPSISIDGEPQAVSDDVETVLVEFDTDSAETHRCTACYEPLTEEDGVYKGGRQGAECTENISDEPDADGDYYYLPHDPEPIPLSWVNSAGVHLNEGEDSVTVTISVGDPRGAFAFTVRRIPADADGELAGRLLMHTPYPGQSSPHMPVKELHPGTYVIGS